MADIDEPVPHRLAANFPWSRLGQPTVTGSQLADKGRRAVRRLGEWGITVPPGSRLLRAIDIVDRRIGETFEAPEVETAAAQTILDFYLITHAQADKPPSPVLERLAEALSGGDRVTSDSDRRPRDVQFELEVWAVFRVGGVDISFREPDLIFQMGAQTIGIAAKRIWSVEQAHKRLSEAAEQIERAGLRGMIATNVQEYLNGVEADLDLASKGKAFDVDVRRLHGQMPYLAGKKHVIGIMLRGTGAKAGADIPGAPRGHAVSNYNQTFMFLEEHEGPPFEDLFKHIGESLQEWYRCHL